MGKIAELGGETADSLLFWSFDLELGRVTCTRKSKRVKDHLQGVNIWIFFHISYKSLQQHEKAATLF